MTVCRGSLLPILSAGAPTPADKMPKHCSASPLTSTTRRALIRAQTSTKAAVLFHDVVHDNIDVDLPLLDIVDPNVTHTRSHSLRIIKQQCRINARVNSSACRNASAWNSLPENVIWCQSRATFKRFIDILDFSNFLPS